MNSSTSQFGAYLIGFALLAVLFLVLRELVLWYWRVNRVVELLESIDRKLGERPGTPS